MTTINDKSIAKTPDKDQRIIEAATTVFAERGFANADTQVIADQAGVGKGTVYRYYSTKEELFLAVADAGMQRLESYIFAAIDGGDGTIDLIRRCGVAYAEFFQRNPQLVEILIHERATFRDSIPSTHLVYRQKNRKVFEDILQGGIDEGVIRDLDVREVTNAFANLLYGTVVCGCLEGSSRRVKRLAEKAIEIFLHGLVVDAALLEQGE